MVTEISAAASPTRLVWRRFLRHRLAEVSLVFLAVLLGLSLAAPDLWLDPYGALLKNLPILAAIAAWSALREDR